MVHKVAVLGASGYAGGELVRLLDDHPVFDPVYLGAGTRAGLHLADVHPQLTGGARRLQPIESSAVPPVDVAFLALPHGASATVAGELLANGAGVVDLGSDYRLDSRERYETAYGDPHPFPDRLGTWSYGLPEVFGDALFNSDRVAVPGCYPTAVVLGLAPLLVAGLVSPEGIVVNAMSGVSGAGRSVRDNLQFGAIDENVGAYSIGRHRHRPEMEMALEKAANLSRVSITFTPHLVPMQRGILATSTAKLVEPRDRATIQEVLEVAYRDSPFVDVGESPPQTRWVVGSNRVRIAAFVDDSTNQVIVVSALDNLIKGAAGQAIQIANLMLGLEEDAGLPAAGWMP